MPQPKETPQRKLQRKAVPVLGAAGLSLSLASGASAAIGGINADPTMSAPPSRQMMLHEEEISDVSLATFHVFDKENVGTQRPPCSSATRLGAARRTSGVCLRCWRRGRTEGRFWTGKQLIRQTSAYPAQAAHQ